MTEKDLYSLPEHAAVFVCGAGGKTTLIHSLASFYKKKGRSVLVTTSAHMRRESGLLSAAEDIKKSLAEKGYAFAGREDPLNAGKIISLDPREVSGLIRTASVTLVEADGARMMPFKVPYPHEPVIWPSVTHLVVMFGGKAEGRHLIDVTYNAEGATAVLSGLTGQPFSGDTVLTEAWMRLALEETYGRQFRARWPGIPYVILKGGGG
jgi:hypothetical protein